MTREQLIVALQDMVDDGGPVMIRQGDDTSTLKAVLCKDQRTIYLLGD